MRDLLLKRRCYYNDLLHAEEGIATNILADRLEKLETAGVISKRVDPDNAARFIYAPTSKGRDLLPVLLAIIDWSAKWDPETLASQDFVTELRRRPSKLLARLLRELQQGRPA